MKTSYFSDRPAIQRAEHDQRRARIIMNQSAALRRQLAKLAFLSS
jgi:hypothetical protein